VDVPPAGNGPSGGYLWRRIAPPIDFWDIAFDDVVGFRDELIRRVNATTVAAWRRDRLGNAVEEARSNPRRLKHGTADRYLMGLYGLCVYHRIPWVMDLAPTTRHARGSGFLGHLRIETADRPKPFKILTPKKFRGRVQKGLPLDVYEEVWEYLDGNWPECPDIVDAPASTATEVRAQSRAERRYDLANMLYLRNKAIWAFFMATGFRKGELVRIRHRERLARGAGGGDTGDFVRDAQTGGLYVNLRDRPEDAYLSELKGGEGRVFIGHTPRFLSHVDVWRDRGLRLAADVRKGTGVPEHPMLFSNADGSPLTLGGVEELFKKIDRAVGVRSRGQYFSPHVCRHTLNSIFKSQGVPLSFRQWFFRHSQPDTTEGYGYVYQDALEGAIGAYHARTMGKQA
jgi:integrase